MSGTDPIRGLTDDPERVSFLQNALWTLGYVPGSIDGIYGPRTIESVRDFQRDVGLDPSGDVDSATWEAMSSLFANELSDTVQLTPSGGADVVSSGRTAPATPRSMRAIGWGPGNDRAPDTPVAVRAVGARAPALGKDDDVKVPK